MKKLFAFAVALTAMVSCSDNLENTPATPALPETPETDKLPINITTTLTRATDSAFEQGDKVGIFVVNEPNSLASSGNHVDNTGFTYAGATWSPDTPIYWLDQTTKASFYCYYPYTENASTTAHTFATKADQSTLENYKASEFLWGTTAGVTPTEEAVGITVNHTFSNILIYLEAGNGFTPESFAAASKSVKINNIKTSAVINLANGVATATGDTTSVTPLNVGSYYRAMIIPQTVADGTALITITVNGIDYNLRSGAVFIANKQHKFTVKVNKSSGSVDIGIGSWNESDNDYSGSAD